MTFPINIGQPLKFDIVEWERLDFKEGWNPEDVAYAMTAYRSSKRYARFSTVIYPNYEDDYTNVVENVAENVAENVVENVVENTKDDTKNDTKNDTKGDAENDTENDTETTFGSATRLLLNNLTIDERKILANGIEHYRIDLKNSTREMKNAMYTTCAFLNTDGRYIVGTQCNIKMSPKMSLKMLLKTETKALDYRLQK